jgi:hypothetical protein
VDGFSAKLADPKFWFSLAAVVISLAALLRSGRALRLQETQEARKQANLLVTWEDGHMRAFLAHRVYGFRLTIRNLSDFGLSRASHYFGASIRSTASAL